MRTTGLGMRTRKPSLLIVATATLLLTATASAGSVTTVTGTTANERLGVIEYAGDVDGDGIGDLLMGSRHDATNGVDAGSVRVVSGADGSTLLLRHGSGAGQQFGASVAGLGDVDGDGFGDIAVGAPGGAGSVAVLSGASGETLWTLTGTTAGGGFGSALSGAGDLDGDGVRDLLVGAPYQSPAGYHSGSAYGVSGANGSELFRLDGSSAGDLFGCSVSGIDPSVGFSDPDGSIVIGATQGDSDTERRGYVRVYDPGDQSLRHELLGGTGWDHLGTTVDHAGDVNGDGVTDLLVSSDPRDQDGAPAGPGFVHVISGSDGSVIHTVTGSTGQGFGMAVAGLGDLDEDGFADFAVGIPQNDANGLDAGMVRIFSGADSSVLQQLSGTAAGDHFGADVCFMGDVNGDAILDIGVAAPLTDTPEQNAGSAMILLLGRWKTMGGGLAGQGGIVPVMGGDGELLEGTEVVLTLEEARPLAPTTLALGSSLFLDPAVDEWVPVPETVITGLSTSATGGLAYTYTWPPGANSVAVYYQFYIADPEAPSGTSRSNAIRGDAP